MGIGSHCTRFFGFWFLVDFRKNGLTLLQQTVTLRLPWEFQ
jgi:hypothetical protein